MTAELVPFGKYKGQPVETLTADAEYCEWLIAQPWFSSKYRNVYNIVVSYGAEPQDSPEHNQMQARFLDGEWCFALADRLRPRRAGRYGIDAARELLDADACYQLFRDCCEVEECGAEAEPSFEDKGWDVTYTIAAASIFTHRTRLVPPLPACSCQCDHAADCGANARCRGGTGEHSISASAYCRHQDHNRGIDARSHCSDDCYWSGNGQLTSDQREWLKQAHHEFGPAYEGRIRVELKPDLGDDYPAVLRQVKGYPSEYRDKRCVVVRRHAFQHVTWEQVQKMFAASGISLLAESEITSPPDPAAGALALVKDRLGATFVAAQTVDDTLPASDETSAATRPAAPPPTRS